MCAQRPRDVTRKLARRLLVPFWKNAFGIERGKLLLDPILELKIQSYFFVGMLVSQNGSCLARVMIAVVKEKNDFAADLLLQMASRRNFSEQESLGKKSVRLLPETNNRLIHGSKRASHASGCFGAAKQSLLQDRRENQYGCASNKIIPEVTDVRRREQNEDERLGEKRRKKHRRSGDSTNKESCQEKTEDAAIEDRSQNVAGFEEILDQTGKRSDADSDQTPRRRQRFRCDDMMMVARVRANQRTIKVDGRGRAESVQRCCRC